MSFHPVVSPAAAFRVFVSYSTKDIELAKQVRATLEGAGAEVFLAQESIQPGDSLTESIRSALAKCDLVVVLWSKHSAASEWVRLEVGHAVGGKKRIVPFVLDSQAPLPPFISDLKYIAAFENVEGGVAELGKRVEALFATRKKQQDNDEQRATAFALVVGVTLLVMALNAKR